MKKIYNFTTKIAFFIKENKGNKKMTSFLNN